MSLRGGPISRAVGSVPAFGPGIGQGQGAEQAGARERKGRGRRTQRQGQEGRRATDAVCARTRPTRLAEGASVSWRCTQGTRADTVATQHGSRHPAAIAPTHARMRHAGERAAVWEREGGRGGGDGRNASAETEALGGCSAPCRVPGLACPGLLGNMLPPPPGQSCPVISLMPQRLTVRPGFSKVPPAGAPADFLFLTSPTRESRSFLIVPAPSRASPLSVKLTPVILLLSSPRALLLCPSSSRRHSLTLIYTIPLSIRLHHDLRC